MRTDTRVIEALEKLQEDRQRLDDAIHHHPVGLARAFSLALTATFIVSCLLAGAPAVETALSGVATGAVTYTGVLILFRLAGEQLFPDTFGPGREEAVARTEPALPQSARSRTPRQESSLERHLPAV